MASNDTKDGQQHDVEWPYEGFGFMVHMTGISFLIGALALVGVAIAWGGAR